MTKIKRAAIDRLMATLETKVATNDLLIQEAKNSEASRLARNAAFSRPGRAIGHGRSIDSAEGLRYAKAGLEEERRKMAAQLHAAKLLLNKPRKQILQVRIALYRSLFKARRKFQKELLESANTWFKAIGDSMPMSSPWLPALERQPYRYQRETRGEFCGSGNPPHLTALPRCQYVPHDPLYLASERGLSWPPPRGLSKAGCVHVAATAAKTKTPFGCVHAAAAAGPAATPTPKDKRNPGGLFEQATISNQRPAQVIQRGDRSKGEKRRKSSQSAGGRGVSSVGVLSQLQSSD